MFGPQNPFAPPPVTGEKKEKEKPSVTIVERDGPRLFHPHSASTSSPFGAPGVPPSSSTARPAFAAPVQPQAGDTVTPNNYLPLSESNPFLCPASLTLGTAATPSLDVQPSRVSLTAFAGRDHLLYDLRISFRNDTNETAAALLSLPRLPDLLLLEEEHTCGTIKYEPRVEEKAKAQAEYDAAASSSNQTATLSETSDDAHHVRMDKVPAGMEATFGVKFLQSGGLKRRGAVLPVAAASNSGDGTKSGETKRSIADLAIMPGFTALDSPRGGIFFDFELRLGKGLHVELPESDVLSQDVKDAGDGYLNEERQQPQNYGSPFGRSSGRFGLPEKKVDILSIVQLSPSLAANGVLRWKSATGLARGTLLKVRILEEKDDTLSDEMSKLNLVAPAAPFAPPSPAVSFLSNSMRGVDTIDGVCHDMSNGTKCDSTLLEVAVPLVLPPTLSDPSPHRHDVYVIVDTSGSTSMRTGEGGQTFLETSKVLLGNILADLPQRIGFLRSKGTINNEAITVRLWSFDSDTRIESEVTLASASGLEGNNSVLPLQTKVVNLRSGGCTNYDSWASKLRECVNANPTHLHSVLLVTDGGATRREQFFESIDAISDNIPSQGFFQVDSLGYGPWLDPRCVSYLAERTGGEALMVESLEGLGTKQKVLSILSRSLVRAASNLAIRIDGAKLLAIAAVGSEAGKPPSPDFFPTCTLRTHPGQKLRMVLLHPNGRRPQLTLSTGTGGGNEILPWPLDSQVDELGGWEVLESNKTSVLGAQQQQHSPSSSSLVSKLARTNTQHALRHLPVLEPAYAVPGTVHYPSVTELDRRNVTLRTSILGQVVAPSVTKGIAVVTLDSPLAPVPEHCRPKPSAVQKKFRGLTFADEEVPSYPYPAGAYGGGGMPGAFGGGFGGAGTIFYSECSAPMPCSAPPPPAAMAARHAAPGGVSFASVSGAPRARRTKASAAPVTKGFKVTKTSTPSVPGIVDWIHTTRGGLFPSEAKRISESSSKGTRLTKKSLSDRFQSDFKRAVSDLGGTGWTTTFTGNVPGDTLPVGLAVARTIECATAMIPDGTGRLDLFEEWITAHKSDLKIMTSTLVYAAARFGVSLSESAVQLPQQLMWPWLEAAQGGVSETTSRSAPSSSGVSRGGASTFAGHRATVPNNDELAARTSQVPMFTPAVRRDIYSVCLNPDHPQAGSDPSGDGAANDGGTGGIPFGAVLVAKATDGKALDTFAFVDRSAASKAGSSLPDGFSVLGDEHMLNAIANIGGTHPNALAVTLAFEEYLSGKVKKWGDKETSNLSVEFLVAFGNELTPRLDVHHRIRSQKLSKEEISTLSEEPFARFVNQDMLKTYQG